MSVGELLDELPRVKVVSRYGVDVVDVLAATSLGIVVSIERACHGGDVPCHGGLELVATDPQVPSRVFAELGVREVGLDELVETSDTVSVHTSLTPATHHLLGKDQIARMNPGAVVINTAGGALIDHAHLARALGDGHLGGAGPDVLEREPPTPEEELLHMSNVVITPHVATYSEEAIRTLHERTASAVVDVLSGRRAPHLAGPEVWAHRRTVPCTA